MDQLLLGGHIPAGPDFSPGQQPHGPGPAEPSHSIAPQGSSSQVHILPFPGFFPVPPGMLRPTGCLGPAQPGGRASCSGRKGGLRWGVTFQREGMSWLLPVTLESAPGPSHWLCHNPHPAHQQPAPDASPMKRSISTLAPQRPHVAHLCNAALDRTPASQAVPHHHHRCHRRRDRKQKSLEKGPSLSAETDGGA